MDSTDFNKIAGAGLGALLIFLLLNFFSGQIYGTREAHQEGEEVLAFALAVETEGGGGAAEEQQVDYAALVAAADPAAGEGDFRACTACHAVEEGVNKVGPSLYGVVGRDIAAIEGFSYSDALMAAEGNWTLEHLSGFLEDPKGWAPGTKMSFAGIKDPQDRVNVIAYLNEADGSPVDLAAGLEPLAAADTGGATDAGPSAVDEGAAVSLPGQAAERVPAGGEQVGESSTGTAAAEGPGQAGGEAGGAPAGSTGAMPGAAETSVSEGDNVGGTVTATTMVDNTEEGADVPTSPAAESEEGERAGQDTLGQGDPSPEAPAQQAPGTAGAPGQGTAPMAGAPDAADAEEDAATPGQAAPSERVEGEDAPPQEAPGQAPERQGAATEGQPAAAGQQATEGQPAAEAPAADADGAQQELAQAPAPAEPAAGAAAGGGGFAGGDAAEGEKLFRRCAACHKVEDGKNGIGPHLWGVVGRDVASVEGYQYSDAMQAQEGAWTAQHLSEYLENPKGVVPGTKMAFAGLKDEQDRIDIITYLNEADGSPEPLQ